MKIILIILILLISLSLKGQEKKVTDYFERYLESIPQENLSESDLEILWEDLLEQYSHPIEINKATFQDLEKLPFLSEQQIIDILKYRNTMSQLYDLSELYAIESLDKTTIELLSLFLTIEKKSKELPSYFKSRHEILFRSKRVFPKAKGYQSINGEEEKYKGSPTQVYFRFKGEHPKNITYGFIEEKDPGEEWWTQNPVGPDFYAGYTEWQSDKIVELILLGDFHLRIGQGLSFWTGSSMGKSTESISIRKTGQGFRGYTSTDENNFLRGIASQLRWKKWEAKILVSRKKRDANILQTNDNTPYSYSSFQNSGSHKTESEKIDKNQLQESWFGGELIFTDKRLKVGTYYLQSYWSLGQEKDVSYPFSYTIDSKTLGIGGAHYYYGRNRIQFFGEVAKSGNKGIGWLQGILASPHPRIELAFLARNYQKDFISIYGSPFGEHSSPINEQGAYFGVKILPNANWQINGYVDVFHFPGPQISVHTPSDGEESLMQILYCPNDEHQSTFRFKYEQKQENTIILDSETTIVDRSKYEIRLQHEWQFSELLCLKGRTEWVRYKKESNRENGWLAYADLKYSKQESPFSGSFRFCYYHTDGYNSRIYAYENDVLYQFSIPALYETGIRSYFNLRYNPINALTLYLKMGYLQRISVDEMGTGNDTTEGNHRTELKFMLRYKF